MQKKLQTVRENIVQYSAAALKHDTDGYLSLQERSLAQQIGCIAKSPEFWCVCQLCIEVRGLEEIKKNSNNPKNNPPIQKKKNWNRFPKDI